MWNIFADADAEEEVVVVKVEMRFFYFRPSTHQESSLSTGKQEGMKEPLYLLVANLLGRYWLLQSVTS